MCFQTFKPDDANLNKSIKTNQEANEQQKNSVNNFKKVNLGRPLIVLVRTGCALQKGDIEAKLLWLC